MNRSVDMEVVVTEYSESGTAILVVDMEQTYNNRKLVVLSTTTCSAPAPLLFHHLKKSVVFCVEASTTGASQLLILPGPGDIQVLGAYSVTDSLFCVSYTARSAFHFSNSHNQSWEPKDLTSAMEAVVLRLRMLDVARKLA
ncbi:hypothetical protein Pelo_1224 [Pelomyxa schiedti]|nr:hypothetical protein Pelo_1224 [Pelomyxa schiedti]